jgi:hypothetical protein
MSFPHLTASFPAIHSTPRTGAPFAQELAILVAEIQQTRDWFNAQIETQLSSLNQLQAAMQVDEPKCSASMATLFEAPQPAAPIESKPAAMMPTFHGVKHQHQAIVLPPTHITALDPELEQATLRELNDALSRAFSEISSRGGMLA